MSDLDFGGVVLGGNVFGWTSDEAASFAVLDGFVASGGRSIDTADVYSAWVPGNSGGESETIVGAWLARRGRRDDVVIGTKVSSLAARPGLSAANITAAVEDSLRRLQTDYIDLYYAHRDDADVAQEETMGAFDALVKSGKVRELGASNFSAERLRSANAIASAAGSTPYTVTQDKWSLVERGIEAALVPTIADLGVVELPYSSLASGFLTGKYRPGVVVDSARAGQAGKYLQNPEDVRLLEVLERVADAHGVSMTAAALAWLRAQPVVGAPIASARTLDQLPALVEGMTLELSAAEVRELGETTVPA